MMLKMLKKNENVYENNFGRTQTVIRDVFVVAAAVDIVPPHYY